jgi:cysteine-rich repeat protein
VVQRGEGCDDVNDVTGDACNPACKVEQQLDFKANDDSLQASMQRPVASVLGVALRYPVVPMPAPAKTTDAEIIGAARALLERYGPDGFSMNDVAAAVGIRAPSLYGRFADRAALLAAVEIEICRLLTRALSRLPKLRDPVASLTAHAHAVRAFAKRNPRGYTLVHSPEASPSEEGTRARAAALAPLMPAFVELVGEADALSAARVLIPFLHGYVSMELANALRMGGSIDDDFESGVATILAGLSQPRARAPRRR